MSYDIHEVFDGAKLVRVSNDSHYVWVWHGGPYIDVQAYDQTGGFDAIDALHVGGDRERAIERMENEVQRYNRKSAGDEPAAFRLDR